MFAKLAIISTLAVLAVATPVPDDGAGQCNVGSLQCCDSVQSSDNKSVQNLLGLLGVALDGLTVPVGLTCTPISIIGLPGNNCAAQPVCCQNNNFNGVVALGCTPINANL